MASIAAIDQQAEQKKTEKKPRRVSKAHFLREYADREDGYKYEWNDGMVEKTQSMNQQQAIIQAVIMRYFVQTQVFKNGGLFTSETNMDTSPVQLRKPDLAIYTNEQLLLMKQGQNQIAPWVAEVISSSDNINHVNQKLDEYFQAGVQVVWHIFPDSKQVYVYISPEQVTICRGKTICSAAPALGDLEIAAEELFV
jgi:Uma2 family endonuclease